MKKIVISEVSEDSVEKLVEEIGQDFPGAKAFLIFGSREVRDSEVSRAIERELYFHFTTKVLDQNQIRGPFYFQRSDDELRYFLTVGASIHHALDSLSEADQLAKKYIRFGAKHVIGIYLTNRLMDSASSIELAIREIKGHSLAKLNQVYVIEEKNEF